MKALYAYIDGGSAPTNPGGVGGYGIVIKYGEETIFAGRGSFPPSPKISNNVMEYVALLKLLDWMDVNSDRDIVVLSDSSILVNQMSANWAIRQGLYKEYALEAKNRLSGKRLSFWKIPREDNIADELSTKAIEDFLNKGDV